MKLIWLLFTATGSLWVAWIKEHVIADKDFWTADFENSGSWIWRRLMKLREIARPFVCCQIQSGNEAFFWHDNWTGLGPLIDIAGENGPLVLGIGSMARVAEAISGDSWDLPRGRHPIIQLIKACLPAEPPALSAALTDVFLWKNSLDSEPGQFKSSRTWQTLFPAPPPVSWHRTVWFKIRIPKHAFLSWVAILNRLPTRDRIRQWSPETPASCLLCDSADENHDHLFLDCFFSREVWSVLFGHSSLSLPADFEAIFRWLPSSSSNIKVRTICNLLVQAIVYALWKERNSRLHTSTSRHALLLVKEVKLILKAKLFGSDRFPSGRLLQQSSSSTETYLQVWFRLFDV